MTKTKTKFASVLALIVATGVLAMTAGAQEGATGPVEVTIAPNETVVLDGGPLVADGGNSITPDTCQQPNPSCTHYRVTMQIDDNPDALNFLVATLEWEVQRTPPLALVAVGLASLAVPDLDMYYYPADYDFDDPDAEADTSGASASQPERIGYTARDGVAEVDIIVNGYIATGTTYTLTLFFSNELFDPPVEVRPPQAVPGSTNSPGTPGNPVTIAIPPAGSSGLRLDPTTDAGDTASNPVPFPIDVDPDFAGTGLSVSESVGSAIDLDDVQTVAAPLEDPGSLSIVFWILVLPLLIAGGGGWVLYRRRPAALQSD